MKIHIERVISVPFCGFELIKIESIEEGFKFLHRLETEWIENRNRFNREGEGYYKISVEKGIVGLGGINNYSFEQEGKRIGRIRRFYIANKWRRKGLGLALLDYIIKEHISNFDFVQLRTDNENASLFYRKYGFTKIDNLDNVTHELLL